MKRIISLVLSVIMIFGVIVLASACGEQKQTESSVTTQTTATETTTAETNTTEVTTVVTSEEVTTIATTETTTEATTVQTTTIVTTEQTTTEATVTETITAETIVTETAVTETTVTETTATETTATETTATETTVTETIVTETTSTETTVTETTVTETTSTETTATETTTATEETVNLNSLKILAIGNSYSQDTTQFVYNIAKDLGYKNIVIVNLYYPGCPLQDHVKYIDTKAYEYEYNATGSWQKKGTVSLSDVINTQEWDVITLQQKSGYSGDPNTFDPYLSQMLNYVKSKCPKAKIYWNMTWAYQANSTESTFSKYNKDQMTMYNAIINTVKTKVLTQSRIDGVIPVGTAVQNMRTSYYGDNLFRDSLHLTYGVGRYLAALMWVKQISGLDINKVVWTPGDFSITEREFTVIKESVNNAYEHPYEITNSIHTVKYTFEDILDMYGIDENNYSILNLITNNYSYYNSTSSSTPVTKDNSTASNLSQFASTQILDKSSLPNGSLILLLDGYQYRPEGWKTLTDKNSSSERPGNVHDSIVLVDDEWWGNFNYRAFNLAKDGNPDLTETEMEQLSSSIRILVPNDPNLPPPDISGAKGVDLESILKKNGYDLADYKILPYEVTFYAYYNSSGSQPSLMYTKKNSTASNLSQFAATNMFTRDDIPMGSLIVLLDGYQYRPEAWTILNAKTNPRPTPVTAELVVVDKYWWRTYQYRAFNISYENNPNLTDEQMHELDSVLFILIPVSTDD